MCTTPPSSRPDDRPPPCRGRRFHLYPTNVRRWRRDSSPPQAHASLGAALVAQVARVASAVAVGAQPAKAATEEAAARGEATRAAAAEAAAKAATRDRALGRTVGRRRRVEQRSDRSPSQGAPRAATAPPRRCRSQWRRGELPSSPRGARRGRGAAAAATAVPWVAAERAVAVAVHAAVPTAADWTAAPAASAVREADTEAALAAEAQEG